ncbi:MAG: PDZ domain-containing protein, partial [OM182 bacterium]|nr:PDZ domain-containing protein [OM182 bacterium]
VIPDSAADAVGLRQNDIILSLNGQTVTDLQTYSNLLRTYAIGDVVAIELNRGEENLTVTATLTARR